jgi:predicted ATP-binding protein involved in virulence
MTFRLNKFQIEEDDFHTSEIQLVDSKKEEPENYYSLIVGNHGAGKSRLLGSITKALTG